MPRYPVTRHRRIRSSSVIRNLVSETYISPSQLILPLFIKDGTDIRKEISSLSGVLTYSIDKVLSAIDEAISFGVRAFALFPCIAQDLKTNCAKEAYNPDNLICRAVSNLKAKYKDEIIIITDVALDPYTMHGHDGIYQDGEILNDETIEILCKQSIVQASSGSDIIAPSDMMDGRISSIRNALDVCNLKNTIILSYAAKYASFLYSPFRDAIGSTVDSIDKTSYQMDFRNHKEALKEVKSDIEEGADMIMIKPATFYLDVIKSASENCDFPVFAYQVSGEYQMFKNAGGINLILESLISIKRAGATSIFCYGAIEVAKALKEI